MLYGGYKLLESAARGKHAERRRKPAKLRRKGFADFHAVFLVCLELFKFENCKCKLDTRTVKISSS